MFWLGLALMVLSACADEVPTEALGLPLPAPEIESLSVGALAVGDELGVFGSGFVDDDQGYVEVTFRGIYRLEDGSEEPVYLTVPLLARDEASVVWEQFGPFEIPFTRAGNELGVFDGEVLATNVGWDGERRRQRSTPAQVTLEVLPSLIIRDLHAVGETFEASCLFVTTRLINLVPYQLRVEAVGFEPEAFVYTASAGLIVDDEPQEEPTVFEHVALGSVDTFGMFESFRFAEVPASTPLYRGSISVEAFTEDGDVHHRVLQLGVHQPLFVRLSNRLEMAEIMEPRPVSSCMSGGITGRDVSYSETNTETRTISATHSMTSGWTESYTEEHTETYGESSTDGGSSSQGGSSTEGGSESVTNRIGFSTTDEENWNWNVHGEVMAGAEGGFGPFAKAKASVTVGGGHDWGGSHSSTSSQDNTTSSESSWSNSSSWNSSATWSDTVSFSEAVSLVEQHQESISEAMSETWIVSSSTSESLNYRAFLIPNHFGIFYRQTTRWIRRGEVVALDLCGNETVVGEFVLNDYTWAPDLAVGTECPPESTLPEAQCLVEPCEEVAW